MPIPFIALGKLALLGKKVWDMIPDETKMELRSGVTDVALSHACGKRTVEEWAEGFVKSIDEVKEQAIKEGNLTYKAGRLKFSLTEEEKKKIEIEKITVSFELYFQDSENQWHKCADSTELSQLFFTPESLEAIKKEEVTFDIT